MIEIEINNRQDDHQIDESRLVAAARKVLESEGITAGEISLAVVDDPTIHDLNKRYLDHDYATDVLSFPFDGDETSVEGEAVVSADYAAAAAAQYGWTIDDELLLYIVHAMLHLVGYDDAEDEDRQKMRELERRYLAEFDLQPHYDEEGEPNR